MKAALLRSSMSKQFCAWIKCLPRKPVGDRERNRLTVLLVDDFSAASRRLVSDLNLGASNVVLHARFFLQIVERVRFGLSIYNHADHPIFFAKVTPRPTNRKHRFARPRVAVEKLLPDFVVIRTLSKIFSSTSCEESSYFAATLSAMSCLEFASKSISSFFCRSGAYGARTQQIGCNALQQNSPLAYGEDCR
jgi:hypothetical protein